jgi:hypothetical protein
VNDLCGEWCHAAVAAMCNMMRRRYDRSLRNPLSVNRPSKPRRAEAA